MIEGVFLEFTNPRTRSHGATKHSKSPSRQSLPLQICPARIGLAKKALCRPSNWSAVCSSPSRHRRFCLDLFRSHPGKTSSWIRRGLIRKSDWRGQVAPFEWGVSDDERERVALTRYAVATGYDSSTRHINASVRFDFGRTITRDVRTELFGLIYSRLALNSRESKLAIPDSIAGAGAL